MPNLWRPAVALLFALLTGGPAPGPTADAEGECLVCLWDEQTNMHGCSPDSGETFCGTEREREVNNCRECEGDSIPGPASGDCPDDCGTAAAITAEYIKHLADSGKRDDWLKLRQHVALDPAIHYNKQRSLIQIVRCGGVRAQFAVTGEGTLILTALAD